MAADPFASLNATSNDDDLYEEYIYDRPLDSPISEEDNGYLKVYDKRDHEYLEITGSLGSLVYRNATEEGYGGVTYGGKKRRGQNKYVVVKRNKSEGHLPIAGDGEELNYAVLNGKQYEQLV